MNTKQLRQKILDLAIRGKLVPQDPTDEPASALLERIHAEKENLIKEGKIKRDKKDSTIIRSADKSHYRKMPQGWALARISDVFIVNPRNVFANSLKVSFVPMTLIDDGFSNRFTFQKRRWNEVKSGFTHFQDGDVGLAKITPCLENRKSVVFRGLMNGIGAGTTELHIFRPICECSIEPNYLLWFIKSEYFISECIRAFSGAVGQQRVGKDFVDNIIIPLPPIVEQKRIVIAIESAFAVIDKIEHNKADLQTIITATKSKILSLAIRGKLVPQDPADEPASVLLERIRAEKKLLIKTGKTGRGKVSSSDIRGDDNSYYGNLPGSWAVCRLGDVSIVKGGKRIPKGLTLSSTPTDHIYIRVTDMKNNTVTFDNLMYIDDVVFEQISNYTIFKDDLYITIAGTIGEVGTIPDVLDGMNLTENAAKLTQITINRLYLMRAIQSMLVQEQFIEKTTQVSQPKLALERITTTIIPLPPLAEQRRIVEAIETAFKQLDSIIASLA